VIELFKKNQVGKNTLWVLVSSILPAIVAVFSLDPIAEHFGVASFTILSFFWLITNQLAVFDLGLSRTVLIETPKTIKSNLPVFIHYIFRQGIANSFWGMVVVILVLIFWHGINPTSFWDVDLNYKILLILWVPLSVIQLITRSIFEGQSLFKEASIYKFINQLLLFGIPLFFVFYNADFSPFIIWIITLSRSIVLVISIYSIYQKTPFKFIGEEKNRINFKTQNNWITVSNFSGLFNSTFERYYLLFIIGANSLAPYVFTQDIVVRVLVLSVSISSVLLPVISRETGYQKNRSWMIYGFMIISGFNIAIWLLMFGVKDIMEPFIISFDLNQIFSIFSILLIGVTANGIGHLFLSALHAHRVTKFPALWHALSATIYVLIILFFVVKHTTLEQIAVIWSLRSIIDTSVLYYLWRRCE